VSACPADPVPHSVVTTAPTAGSPVNTTLRSLWLFVSATIAVPSLGCTAIPLGCLNFTPVPVPSTSPLVEPATVQTWSVLSLMAFNLCVVWSTTYTMVPSLETATPVGFLNFAALIVPTTSPFEDPARFDTASAVFGTLSRHDADTPRSRRPAATSQTPLAFTLSGSRCTECMALTILACTPQAAASSQCDPSGSTPAASRARRQANVQ